MPKDLELAKELEKIYLEQPPDKIHESAWTYVAKHVNQMLIDRAIEELNKLMPPFREDGPQDINEVELYMTVGQRIIELQKEKELL